MCGKIFPCEVHHKKPLSLGGTNDKSNLIYICEECHGDLHKSNRSEMIKAGMRNPNKNRELVIGYYELWAEILQLLIEKPNPTIIDIFDIIYSIDVHKNSRKDGEKYYRKCLELLADYTTESEAHDDDER